MTKHGIDASAAPQILMYHDSGIEVLHYVFGQDPYQATLTDRHLHDADSKPGTDC